MGTFGSFGYKIGRKIRLMRVHMDADLLWKICVREIYVLIQHFGSIELLQQAFEQLKEAKGTPKPDVIEKCKVFASFEGIEYNRTNEWQHLLRYCQHSFINIIETGYFLNNGKEDGYVFLLDFNTKTVHFYEAEMKLVKGKEKEKEKEKGNSKKEVITKTDIETATIEEVMQFEEMPTKTYTEITTNMRERFDKYMENLNKIKVELENIERIIQRAKELGNDLNIIYKAKQLEDMMTTEKSRLELNYRFFYHRLEALNLIDHDN